jgi:hypothetical protein
MIRNIITIEYGYLFKWSIHEKVRINSKTLNVTYHDIARYGFNTLIASINQAILIVEEKYLNRDILVISPEWSEKFRYNDITCLLTDNDYLTVTKDNIVEVLLRYA